MTQKRLEKNVFPKGWDEKRVRELIEYYDHQTDAEAVAEYRAASRKRSQTLMIVPTKLVPAVRAFIAHAAGAASARPRRRVSA